MKHPVSSFQYILQFRAVCDCLVHTFTRKLMCWIANVVSEVCLSYVSYCHLIGIWYLKAPPPEWPVAVASRGDLLHLDQVKETCLVQLLVFWCYSVVDSLNPFSLSLFVTEHLLCVSKVALITDQTIICLVCQ